MDLCNSKQVVRVDLIGKRTFKQRLEGKNGEEEKYLSFYLKFLAGASVTKSRLIAEKHETYLI